MEYVGLDNFARTRSGPLFWKAILNTLVFLAIHIPATDHHCPCPGLFSEPEALHPGLLSETPSSAGSDLRSGGHHLWATVVRI